MMLHISRRMFSISLVIALALTGAATARAETATLKGKFVLDGPAPAEQKITVNQDAAVCGKHNLVKEALVVSKDGAIANVCIWLYAPKLKAPAGTPAPGPAVLDNHDCKFTPHILMMTAGQVLELKNSDSVPHNTKGSPRNNPEFNVIIQPNSSQQIKNITKPESKPFQVGCNIHAWMTGYVIVTEGPYAAVSGPDGSFEIKGLPVGTQLEFQVWQERGGYVKDVTVDGKKTTWSLGRFKMKLKAGDNDLGTIQAKIGGG